MERGSYQSCLHSIAYREHTINHGAACKPSTIIPLPALSLLHVRYGSDLLLKPLTPIQEITIPFFCLPSCHYPRRRARPVTIETISLVDQGANLLQIVLRLGSEGRQHP